jgi:hypothetical protein
VYKFVCLYHDVRIRNFNVTNQVKVSYLITLYSLSENHHLIIMISATLNRLKWLTSVSDNKLRSSPECWSLCEDCRKFTNLMKSRAPAVLPLRGHAMLV